MIVLYDPFDNSKKGAVDIWRGGVVSVLIGRSYIKGSKLLCRFMLLGQDDTQWDMIHEESPLFPELENDNYLWP